MKNTRYQIKVTLEGLEPPIWRRLIVPADCTMDALHCALQAAMGWEDRHLYAFEMRKGRRVLRRVEIPDPDDMWDPAWHSGPKPEDSAKVRLRDFAGPGGTFAYIYDFGDSWKHEVTIEKIVDDLSASRAECMDGARACPPEDCGGPWGYQRLLELLDAPDQKLDLDDINAALANWKPNQSSFMYEGICG